MWILDFQSAEKEPVEIYDLANMSATSRRVSTQRFTLLRFQTKVASFAVHPLQPHLIVCLTNTGFYVIQLEHLR